MKQIARNLCYGGILALAASAKADTETVCTLQLRGYAWGNSLDSSFRLESNRLAYTGIGLNGPMGRAEAGDIGANWNTLGLGGRGFQGVKYQLPGEKLQTSVIAGRVSVLDLLGQQESSSGIFGLQVIKPLSARTQVGVASLLTPGAGDRDGPYVNTLSFGYNPTRNQTYNAELAQSNHGYGMQLAGSGRDSKLYWRGSARMASRNFSTATNPLLRTDRNGTSLYTEYKITPDFGLNFNSQRYGDGFGGRSNFGSLGLNWRVSPNTRISISRDSNSTNSRFADLTSNFQDIRGKSYGVQLAQQVGKNAFFLAFNRQNFDFPDSTSGVDALKNNLIQMNWSRPISQRTTMSLTHLLYNSDGGVGTQTIKGGATAFDLNYNIGRRGESIGLGAQLQNSQNGARTDKSVSPLVRLTLPLKKQDYLSVAYQARVVTAGFQGVQTPNRLYITYSKRVQFGPAPTRAQLLGVDVKKTLVTVSGQAYDDANGNGVCDAGEVGLPGVTVTLLTGESTKTDANGRYVFKNLEPRKQRVSLAVKTLPLELSPLSETDVMLNPSPGQSININFPIAKTGQINGIVFEDINKNGVRDANEPGIEGVVVRVVGSPVISFSGAEGKFRLTDLSPRVWTIGIDPGNLPEGYVTSGDAVQSFHVKPNQITEGAVLGVAKYERTAAQTFVFGKSVPPVFENPSAPTHVEPSPIPSAPKVTNGSVLYQASLRLPDGESPEQLQAVRARRLAWQRSKTKPVAKKKPTAPKLMASTR